MCIVVKYLLSLFCGKSNLCMIGEMIACLRDINAC